MPLPPAAAGPGRVGQPAWPWGTCLACRAPQQPCPRLRLETPPGGLRLGAGAAGRAGSRRPPRRAPSPSAPRSCTFEGVASLVLASGPPQDAYTVCLPALTLSVGPNENGECAVTLTPHPMVDRLKFALEVS